MKTQYITFLLVIASLLCRAQQASEDLMALQYYQNGEYDKALSIYQKLFNEGRNNIQYYDSYLNTLFKLKDFDIAEKLVRRMLATNKDNYNYQIDVGRVLSERGEPEKATEWYNSLLKKIPKEEYAIRDLAITFYRAEAYDFSIKTLLMGRKELNDPTAFTFDLISLYRYQKNKVMLVQEYVSLLSNQADVQLINQAKSTFSNLFESPRDYDLLKATLLKKLQKEPQNIALSEMLAWQYIQQKEFDLALKQILALDKRLKESGERVYDLASLFAANKAYPQAIEALEYLLSKGKDGPFYIPAKMQILYTRNQQLTSGKYTPSDLLQLEKDYLSLIAEFGKTKNTAFAMRQLASLQASYLNKAEAAKSLLEEVVDIPGLPVGFIAETKLELGDIYILTGEVWEAALIYGQVEKQFTNEPIGQEAKYRGAKLSYYQGDFTWAKAQLDVLKSSTSQLIANDALNLSLIIAGNTNSEEDSNALKKFAKADFLIFIKQYDNALKTLDSIDVIYPENSLTDDILMSKAKIFQNQNLTEKAIDVLNSIIVDHNKGVWADDALFMLAEIYESKKNTSKAMEYYQRIIVDFPGSLYVAEARKRFRNLRGDNVG